MQAIKILFGLFLALFCLIGCKTLKEPPKETEKETIIKTITETQRDTIVQIKADSSYYQAWIECQDGKPKIIKPPQTQAGEHLKPPLVNLSDNGKLEVKCEDIQRQLNITLKEKQVLEERLKEKTIIPPPIEVEKPLTFWQELWIKFGKLSAIIGLIYLGFKIPWRRFVKPF